MRRRIPVPGAQDTRQPFQASYDFESHADEWKLKSPSFFFFFFCFSMQLRHQCDLDPERLQADSEDGGVS